jgi:hypothetical protein
MNKIKAKEVITIPSCGDCIHRHSVQEVKSAMTEYLFCKKCVRRARHLKDYYEAPNVSDK